MKTMRVTYLTEVPDDESLDATARWARAAVFVANLATSTKYAKLELESVEEVVSLKKAKPRSKGRPL